MATHKSKGKRINMIFTPSEWAFIEATQRASPFPLTIPSIVHGLLAAGIKQHTIKK